jgi:hypothetical protein
MEIEIQYSKTPSHHFSQARACKKWSYLRITRDFPEKTPPHRHDPEHVFRDETGWSFIFLQKFSRLSLIVSFAKCFVISIMKYFLASILI